MKRILVILILITFLNACQQEKDHAKQARPVIAIKIEKPISLILRSFPGRATATRELNLGFEVAGTIVALPVNKGDTVKKGQLLSKLDPRDFENVLLASVAEQDRAQAYRNRIHEAVQANAVSKQDLTDAEAALKLAKANVNIKRKALEDSVMRAPFDGVIAWRYKETYQRVSAKEIILRLLDISKIEFTVNIPEHLISEAENVKHVTIRFDAFRNREIPASIKEIGTEASIATHTYPVTLIFDQPDDITILPGMAGVTYGGEEKADRPEHNWFVVPVSAIFTPDGEKSSFVWLIDKKAKTVKRIPVKLDRLTKEGMRVQGIKQGQWIVVTGVNSLKPEQKVEVIHK